MGVRPHPKNIHRGGAEARRKNKNQSQNRRARRKPGALRGVLTQRAENGARGKSSPLETILLSFIGGQ